MFHDVKFSLRFRRKTSFAVTAILILAVGIGATSAVFQRGGPAADSQPAVFGFGAAGLGGLAPIRFSMATS